jgi:ketosteroid isomerase-like protein
MNMSIALPAPVAAFFAAEREQDLDALARCFADHAVVRDEGRTIEGPPDIKRWMRAAKAKYEHTVEPIAVSSRDGTTIVVARVAGKFPNSPLDLEHVFTIERGKISSLEIR